MLTAHYIMIGGFLGAGKTTSILRLAQHFSSLGKRVGLIANDQSQGLVDTAMLANSGLPTEEISGGCFCCKFNSLIEACENLDAHSKPEIYLAEPVGSCTDLVATVVTPLQQLHADRYRIAPLSVLVDPIRAQRFLGLLTGKTFSPKVNYIYDRQLEEADLIVINKSDLLQTDQLQTLVSTLEKRYPKAKVLSVCARTGEGFEQWLEALTPSAKTNQGSMPVDYQLYAEGEALLGWVNVSAHIRGAEFDGNQFLLTLLEDLHQSLLNQSKDLSLIHI
jgi:G3E family GTPase